MREQPLRREEGSVQSGGGLVAPRAPQLRIEPADEPRGVPAGGAAPSRPAFDQLGAWEKFYGFYRRPFSLTPDLRFAFNSQSHAHAFQQVTQALKRREGLIVVTGDIGTGKTMLCRSLLETFEARTFLCVILDPRLTVDDLLRQILTDFGLLKRSAAPATTAAPGSRHQLVSTLQQFLASLVPLNAHAVVMIDEAQQLEPEVLEQIRLLSNFETDEAKLLQIVLVGQPDLDVVLQRPDMRQLNQRVARRCELHPLSATEVGEYIGRRLAVAAEPPSGVAWISADPQGTGRIAVEFDAAAVSAVAALSDGIPRLVNTLCDRALEVGYERQARTIDAAIVWAAAEQLKLAPAQAAAPLAAAPLELPESAGRGPFNVRVVMAALLIVAAAAGWLAWVRMSGGPAPAPAAVASAAAVTSVPAAQASDGRAGAPLPEPTAAPAQPAKPIAAPAVAQPASGTFHIRVAAFRTEQRASAVAAALKEHGLPTYTRLDPASEWRLVIAGPFTSSADASVAQRALAAEGFPDTRVVADP
jgi:general secretion pathway protein A